MATVSGACTPSGRLNQLRLAAKIQLQLFLYSLHACSAKSIHNIYYSMRLDAPPVLLTESILIGPCCHQIWVSPLALLLLKALEDSVCGKQR
ncbi:hypothetical protein BX600DRAFT_62268 [Xylariales sp. PMI_506]|nr:hypothetical protein BX600DRAFT_62268 [Xylariales sp. PMI_506]